MKTSLQNSLWNSRENFYLKVETHFLRKKHQTRIIQSSGSKGKFLFDLSEKSGLDKK